MFFAEPGLKCSVCFNSCVGLHVIAPLALSAVLLFSADLPRSGAQQCLGRLGDFWLPSVRPVLWAAQGPDCHGYPGRWKGQSSWEVSQVSCGSVWIGFWAECCNRAAGFCVSVRMFHLFISLFMFYHRCYVRLAVAALDVMIKGGSDSEWWAHEWLVISQWVSFIYSVTATP